MAASAAGIEYPGLMERIINLATERYEGRRSPGQGGGKLRESA
jgi:hypothetical protein